MSDPAELRAELAAASRQARALLEWLADSGAEGVPVGDAASALAAPVEDEIRTPTSRERAAGTAGRRAVAAAPDRAPNDRQAAPRAETVDSRPRPEPPAASPSTARSPGAPAAPPSVDPTERQAALEALDQQVRQCTRCPLHEHRRNTVFARGSAQARLTFVGEGPGAEEDAQGVPFVGPAGQLLDRMIEAMGLHPDEVYICNIVKCRPPGNRKPTVDEMQACMPFLREQLALVASEVLVALGATAAQGLLGWWDAGPRGPGITRLRGNWKIYDGLTPIMPTFHPAYLLRSPEKKRDVWSDLQQVMGRLGLQPPATKGSRSGG